MNLRPPGYEPDELPTAPLRDIYLPVAYCVVPVTGLEPVQYRYRGILSPLCLPIPPHRRISATVNITQRKRSVNTSAGKTFAAFPTKSGGGLRYTERLGRISLSHEVMEMQKPRRRTAHKLLSCILAFATLWTVSVTAPAKNAAEALAVLEDGALPVFLLRLERGDLFTFDELSVPTALALSMQPLLLEGRGEIVAAWSDELQQMPVTDSEDGEGTVLTQPAKPDEITVTDNGVPSRTLKPSDPAGYTVFNGIYINNASDAALNVSQLTGDFAAKLQSGGPQVLIIHTHGTEAYTMPPGEEYEPSDNHRTLESDKNMLRIGDEMAEILTSRGIGVVHDRNLYDYPNYSGAYDRSLASIKKYLAQYPTISFVLDVHRDAVEDTNGSEYKLLCAEESNAAQLEFVIGSNGGGLSHDHWRENLKLACAVQQTLSVQYPTLMRPIVVRNSRYNQHMTTGSLLIEVGAAGNSLAEAIVAARIFAEGFAATIQN